MELFLLTMSITIIDSKGEDKDGDHDKGYYSNKIRTLFLVPYGMIQWAIMMGIEHERVHLETSAVLIRQLPIGLVSCPPGWIYGPTKAGLKKFFVLCLLSTGKSMSLSKRLY